MMCFQWAGGHMALIMWPKATATPAAAARPAMPTRRTPRRDGPVTRANRNVSKILTVAYNQYLLNDVDYSVTTHRRS